MVNAGDPLVVLDHVSMTYGHGQQAVKAVDDLTLTIRKGEFIAVVGPSGCGKSSMMKLISGLKPTSEGRLTIEGKAVTGPINKVGMAFQAANLLPWRTAEDNVLLPLEIVEPHRSRIGREHWQAAVHRVAAAVGERVLDVRAARIRVAEAERALKIAEAEADVADAARALARRMYEAGTIAFKQLAAERAAAADAALEAVEARAQRDSARLALAVAIGWADVASLPVIDQRLDLPSGDDTARDALVERAMREHPEVIAARHEEQAALRVARIARRAW